MRFATLANSRGGRRRLMGVVPINPVCNMVMHFWASSSLPNTHSSIPTKGYRFLGLLFVPDGKAIGELALSTADHTLTTFLNAGELLNTVAPTSLLSMVPDT